MADVKYIKVGESGRLITAKDCYNYTYDHGDGRTVLRVAIKDSDITVAEIIEIFNNPENNPIYEYKLVTPPPASIEAVTNPDLIVTEPQYELVAMYENYCKEMSYEYANHVFSIEVMKKLKEEIISEENQQATNEVMMAIADMYAL